MNPNSSENEPTPAPAPAELSVEVKREIVLQWRFTCRAIAAVVRVTGRYKCNIDARYDDDDETFDAKSLMGFLMLGGKPEDMVLVESEGAVHRYLKAGAKLCITARGIDAPAAMEAIEGVFSNPEHDCDRPGGSPGGRIVWPVLGARKVPLPVSELDKSLARFVLAQRSVFPAARPGLMVGKVEGSWVNVLFPHHVDFPTYSCNKELGIHGIEEAQDYLAHPMLGSRLCECSWFLLRHKDRTIGEILPAPYDLQLASSMTLFNRAAGGDYNIFLEVLRCFFQSREDESTLRLLALEVEPKLPGSKPTLHPT